MPQALVTTRVCRRLISAGCLVICNLFAAQTALPAERHLQIEIIVPWGSGGGADQVARKMAKLLGPSLETEIPVVNLPGDDGRKGLSRMFASRKGALALSIMTSDTFGLLAQQPGWQLRDILPLAVLVQQPSFLLAHEGGKLNTWADVEAAARTREVRIAITGPSSTDELAIKHLSYKGLRFVAVPFTKPGERQMAILNGGVDLLYDQIADVRDLVKNGQLHPVLLFAEQRDLGLKDVPASAEFGYHVALPQFRVLIGRPGMPASTVHRICRALSGVATDPEYLSYLREQYADENSFLGCESAPAFMQDRLEVVRALFAEQNALADP